MANKWNERRRKHKSERIVPGEVITKEQFAEMLRERGYCSNVIRAAISSLPFKDKYLVGVRFLPKYQIEFDWKKKPDSKRRKKSP